jgi:hypothetical protein
VLNNLILLSLFCALELLLHSEVKSKNQVTAAIVPIFIVNEEKTENRHFMTLPTSVIYGREALYFLQNVS